MTLSTSTRGAMAGKSKLSAPPMPQVAVKRGFWAVPMVLLAAVALLGVFQPTPFSMAEKGTLVGADVAWMLTASGLVLLMTPGLAFFYGGMVQRKNVISTILQSFIAMGVISLLWVVVGFSLSFGDSIGGFVGNPATFFMFRGVGGAVNAALAPTIPLALFALFQMKFAIITPALITGAFAERVRFASLLLFICLFSLFIYAPLAHWTWHPDGILRKMGVLDFAGGTVVHMSAGLAALAGAMFLGRRESHKAGEPHVPANIPMVLLGMGMLWFGWFGFNAGSALAANETAVLAFLTTNTASAAAVLGWVLTDAVRGRKISGLGVAIGAVVGLVAITPAAGFVSVGASMFIGLVAAVVCNLAATWRSKSSLDDTLDVFPCHGLGGIIGMVMTGIFANDLGLAFGQTKTFMAHMVGLCIVALYTFVGAFVLYKITNWLIPMRVSATDFAKLGLISPSMVSRSKLRVRLFYSVCVGG